MAGPSKPTHCGPIAANGSSSALRQFRQSMSTMPTVFYVEHVENRTLLAMQFDERWRRASTNATLGIASVIDYDTYLASTSTTVLSLFLDRTMPS